MALTTSLKNYINNYLRRVNLQVETLTAEKLERRRLEDLMQSGHFLRPVFPTPPTFNSIEVKSVLVELQKYEKRFNDFEEASHNIVGYTFVNDYFSSPDAEVLYAMVRKFQPRKVIEVGSGHSTRIIRQAILDGYLNTCLVSIDPYPRREISGLVERFYPKTVETLGDPELFSSLQGNDFLFIDSSHEVRTGNDVVFLYLNIIPELHPGVMIHIHDIFLPYDYPKEWIMQKHWPFTEQYLVQAMLNFSNIFEVLWAGYFLQRTRSDFEKYFPHLNGQTAKSLWLRKSG